MPKAAAPGTAHVGSTSFSADALPDVFDERDLDYRPRLQPLPAVQDRRSENRYVREQQGNSCTGHALAAVIDAVLAGQDTTVPRGRVSARMLYRLARRYDEFEGETDVGSSLRGALKAWLHHGVLPDSAWRGDDDAMELRLERNARLAARAMECPLGAFYRINAFHLDDLHSAIVELYGIIASAAVHEGWLEPAGETHDGKSIRVIRRGDDTAPIGGHAFAIVGYNAVGFLVQNSWGRRWGKDGFATLPYDDWLDSAYDAWVARPGVPSVVTPRHQHKTVTGVGSARRLVETAGVDQAPLIHHVVNLGNDGKLSTSGGFSSSPAQLDGIFEHMDATHRQWAGPRHVVLYAHGGLTDEKTGLGVANKHLYWWLHNTVYPINFAWQTGAGETLLNVLADLVKSRLPFGWSPADLLSDQVERVDRMVENLARTAIRPVWDEMKENADKASHDGGGAAQTVERLRAYAAAHDDMQVHLVGHSAGSIFLVGLLDRLRTARVAVESLTYLAPAIRTDRFVADVLPRLRGAAGTRPRFTSFGLSAERELDDVCAAGRVPIYRKSLLYLVSRALERSAAGDDEQTYPEVSLAGMQRHARAEVAGTSFEDAVNDVGGDLVWAPSTAPANSRTKPDTHGGFDEDGDTMTSVVLRILGRASADEVVRFTT